MSLAGRAALVTGSTSGIGLGIARALAGAGANIMLNGLGETRAIDATEPNAACIAAVTSCATASLIQMATSVGPEPLIVQAKAPASIAARFTALKCGMSAARRGSAMCVAARSPAGGAQSRARPRSSKGSQGSLRKSVGARDGTARGDRRCRRARGPAADAVSKHACDVDRRRATADRRTARCHVFAKPALGAKGISRMTVRLSLLERMKRRNRPVL